MFFLICNLQYKLAYSFLFLKTFTLFCKTTLTVFFELGIKHSLLGLAYICNYKIYISIRFYFSSGEFHLNLHYQTRIFNCQSFRKRNIGHSTTLCSYYLVHRFIVTTINIRNNITTSLNAFLFSFELCYICKNNLLKPILN